MKGVWTKEQGSSESMPPIIYIDEKKRAQWRSTNEDKIDKCKAALINKYGSLENVPEHMRPRTMPLPQPTKEEEEDSDDDNAWGSWTGKPQPVKEEAAENEEAAGSGSLAIGIAIAGGTAPGSQRKVDAVMTSEGAAGKSYHGAGTLAKPNPKKQPWKFPTRRRPSPVKLEPETERPEAADADWDWADRQSDWEANPDTGKEMEEYKMDNDCQQWKKWEQWEQEGQQWGVRRPAREIKVEWERKLQWKQWEQWKKEQEDQCYENKWEYNVKQEQHWQEPAEPADAAAEAPRAPTVKQEPKQEAADAAPSVKKKKKQEQPEQM